MSVAPCHLSSASHLVFFLLTEFQRTFTFAPFTITGCWSLNVNTLSNVGTPLLVFHPSTLLLYFYVNVLLDLSQNEFSQRITVSVGHQFVVGDAGPAVAR